MQSFDEVMRYVFMVFCFVLLLVAAIPMFVWVFGFVCDEIYNLKQHPLLRHKEEESPELVEAEPVDTSEEWSCTRHKAAYNKTKELPQ